MRISQVQLAVTVQGLTNEEMEEIKQGLSAYLPAFLAVLSTLDDLFCIICIKLEARLCSPPADELLDKGQTLNIMEKVGPTCSALLTQYTLFCNTIPCICLQAKSMRKMQYLKRLIWTNCGPASTLPVLA